MHHQEKQAVIVLADGTRYAGVAFGSEKSVSGEIVFTTGMVGYPESLTDPSYHRQLLVMTYPLVGNYGVVARKPNSQRAPDSWESDKIHARALIVSSYIDQPSHYASSQTLGRWLAQENVLGVSGIDTRALTTRLREQGTMRAEVIVSGEQPIDALTEPMIADVSCERPRRLGGSGKHVVVIDCGVKLSIIRSLQRRGCRITQVPWDYPVSRLSDCDGVVVSNGPGNPVNANQTIVELRRLIGRRMPLWGICLGHQLLALALGARTYKLPYGHRGQNQPVIDVVTGRAYITSQNHGYAVRERSLPRQLLPWFRNLNDGTNEGFQHRSRPLWAVQFHPEAAPGPADTAWLFDSFMRKLL